MTVSLLLCFYSLQSIAETGTDQQQTENTPVSPTPQPPLLDAQSILEESAEPTSSSDEKSTSDTTAVQPDPTPQPPLVDAQQQPAYGPDHGSNQDKATNNSQPAVSSQSKRSVEQAQEQSIRWLDTRPKLVSADWLQLTSGEWLRGRIISMQKDVLNFESDELDRLEIDWDKVRYLKSSAHYSLRFDNSVVATGAIEVIPDKIFISTDYDDQEFDRNKLLIIASGKDSELSLWTSKITLSLNVRQGNTEQTDFTARANAQRRSLLSRLLLDYIGNITSVKETQTINNHRATGTYDIFITRDFFWTLISAEYFRDPFQNIDRRVRTYTALGYSIIHNTDTEWEISAGPGYQATTYVSVQEGSPKDSSIVMVLGTRFETSLNSMIDLEGSYTASIGDSRTGNYTHNALLTVETELTDRLDFDVTLTWDRTQEPEPDENNLEPKQDDFKMMFGLAFEL